MACIKNISCL